MNHSPPNFPVRAFPDPMRAALEEAATNIQAPIPMLASAMVSTASSAIQGLVNVRRPNGLRGPCSLMFLTIAESGERKTACDEVFARAIREFERKELAAEKPALAVYEAELFAWEEKVNTLKAAISKSIKKETTNPPSSTLELQVELAEHFQTKPQRPRTLQLLIQDSTPEGIVNRVQNYCPLLFLSCDEGGKILNANLGRSLTLLNSMRDGSAQHIDRKTSGHQIIPFVRLSSHIQAQPKTMQRFLENQGNLARDNGFIARNLVAYPNSTQGLRFINCFDEFRWPSVDQFDKRITELLCENKELHHTAIEELPDVEFSQEAALEWVRFANHIEAHQQPNCLYSRVRDAASKTAENAARLAAIFHKYQNHDGKISRETLERAIAICHWYLDSFKSIFDAPPIPQVVLDVQTLEAWLWNHNRATGDLVFKKNLVRQYGPLRSKLALDAALATLVAHGRVTCFRQGKTSFVGLYLQQLQAHAQL